MVLILVLHTEEISLIMQSTLIPENFPYNSGCGFLALSLITQKQSIALSDALSVKETR